MTRGVAAVLVAIFATFAIQVMVLILAPLRAVELGLSAGVAAALVAAWGLLGIVFDIPGAALSDSLGRRIIIAIGGAAMVGSTLALLVARDLPGLFIGMILFGIAQALAFGPALAFLTEITSPAAHTRVQGINGAGQGAASVVGALTAGALAQVDITLGILVVGLLAVIVLLVILPVADAPRRGPGYTRSTALHGLVGSYRRALDMMLSRPAIGFSSLLSVLYAIVFLVVSASILPLVLVDIEGYTAGLAGLMVAFRNLVSAALSLSFAAVTSRFGLVRTVVSMSWLAVLGTGLLAATTGSPWLLAIALVIQAAGMAYGAAAANVLVTGSTSVSERAVGMSATTVASRITVLVVPLVMAPLIWPETGAPAFLAAAIIGVPVVLGMRAIAHRMTGRSAIVARIPGGT